MAFNISLSMLGQDRVLAIRSGSASGSLNFRNAKDSLAVADKAPPTKIPSALTPGPTAGPASKPERQPVAIAIEHNATRQGAPKITAKGRGAIAEQILQIAFDRGIKVRSDADLAEILEAVEVDSIVPLEALAAVAEILSYVYRTQSSVTPERQS